MGLVITATGGRGEATVAATRREMIEMNHPHPLVIGFPSTTCSVPAAWDSNRNLLKVEVWILLRKREICILNYCGIYVITGDA